MVVQRLFGLVAVGVGGLFVYNAAQTFQATERRQEYEPIEARILESEVETDVSPSAEDPSENMTRYLPNIEYEYTVGGETHVNDNVYPGPTTSGSHTEEETQELVDRYPAGETVEAFYDPDDPAASFLENESQNRQAISLGILGAAGLIFGLVLLVAAPF
jgi:hypothetical protein